MKVTTTSGYEYDLDENILDDWATIQEVIRADSDDNVEKLRGINALVSIVYGDHLDDYMHHIADKFNGYRPISVISEDLMGILEGINQGNS